MVKNLSIIAILMMCVLFGLYISDYMKLPSKELVIYYTSNLRGQIKPYSGIVLDHKYDQAGGFAFIQGFINNMSKAFGFKKENTLLLDTGDALFGSAEATLLMGDLPLKLMGKMGYDAMAVGNLEFEYGFNVLQNFIKSNTVPMLACNYRDLSAPVKNTFVPSIMVKKASANIGIIGLGHEELAKNTRQENIENVEIINMQSAVQTAALDLKAKGAEIIILLAHHPVAQHEESVENLFPDVDIIIGDLILAKRISGSKPVLCQTAVSRGGGIGMIKVGYFGGKWDIMGLYNNVFPVNASDITPDSELAAEIGRYESMIDSRLEEKITHSKGSFNHSYTEESSIGCLIADCMREISGAQVALTNSGGIKTSLSEGEVTLRKLYNIMPYENQLVVLEMTGAQLEDLIELSLSGKTGFLQSSGIDCTYSSSNPSGFRIIQIDIDGQPLEFDATYSVAVNDFMHKNDLEWPELSQGKNAVIKGLIRENLVKNLKNKQFISPETKKRFVDFQELDETLRLQALGHSLTTLDKPYKHSNSSESDYARLLAEVIRLETKADFALMSVDLIRPSRDELFSITPSKILSDFSASQGAGVKILDLTGENLEKIAAYGTGKGSASPIGIAGFSVEQYEGGKVKIHPWKNSFEKEAIYKVAVNEHFPLKLEGVYNVTKAKTRLFSSDIRRTFINGLRARDGKVEIKRAIY